MHWIQCVHWCTLVCTGVHIVANYKENAYALICISMQQLESGVHYTLYLSLIKTEKKGKKEMFEPLSCCTFGFT